jgi:hypothetical protein
MIRAIEVDTIPARRKDDGGADSARAWLESHGAPFPPIIASLAFRHRWQIPGDLPVFVRRFGSPASMRKPYKSAGPEYTEIVGLTGFIAVVFVEPPKGLM